MCSSQCMCSSKMLQIPDIFALSMQEKEFLENHFLVSVHIQIQHTAQPTGENTDENSLCLISVIKMTAIKPKTQKGKISWVLIDCRSQEQ